MKKRIISTLLAVALLCTMAGFAQAVGPEGISLKDGSNELLSFDAEVYSYSVQPDTWTTSLSLTVDDANAIVYTNAGTGVVGRNGAYTVNLAPIGSATGITVITGGKTYFINSKHAPIKPSAEVTSFAFLRENNPGLKNDITAVVDAEAGTITVSEPIPPVGTLVPTFTHTGVALRVNGLDQVSGESAQDFTKAKKPTYYLVTADGLDAIYTLDVTLGYLIAAETEKPLIEEIPGAIHLTVTGENLDSRDFVAHLKVGDELLWTTTLTGGVGTMDIAPLPAAGVYEVVLFVDGVEAASTEVTIEPKATEVVINAPKMVSVKKGKTLQLDVTSNAALLVYSSSNTGVATVNQNGLVTGVKTGMTVILVYAADNSQKFASIIVNVIA